MTVGTSKEYPDLIFPQQNAVSKSLNTTWPKNDVVNVRNHCLTRTDILLKLKTKFTEDIQG